MLEKMRKMLAEQLDLSEDQIKPESRFKEDLEADSLDLFEMLTTLEEEFDIEIPDEALEKMRSVADLVRFVESC